MNIQTKFKYQQEIWFMNNNKTDTKKILKILTETNNDKTEIRYVVSNKINGNEGILQEKDCFETKELLLQSL